jgi:hypothetical protein
MQRSPQTDVLLHKSGHPEIGKIDLSLPGALPVNKDLTTRKIQILVANRHHLTGSNSCSDKQGDAEQGGGFDGSHEVNVCAVESRNAGLAGEMREESEEVVPRNCTRKRMRPPKV